MIFEHDKNILDHKTQCVLRERSFYCFPRKEASFFVKMRCFTNKEYGHMILQICYNIYQSQCTEFQWLMYTNRNLGRYGKVRSTNVRRYSTPMFPGRMSRIFIKNKDRAICFNKTWSYLIIGSFNTDLWQYTTAESVKHTASDVWIPEIRLLIRFRGFGTNHRWSYDSIYFSKPRSLIF